MNLMINALDRLQNELNKNKLTHAYLFVGNDTERIDKAVEIIINKTECLKSDIIRVLPDDENNKSGEIKVDQIREIIHRVNLSAGGGVKIIIIYGAERLNQSSGNILLKSLEEPPKSTIFILVSKSDFLLSTIKSRCRAYKFFSTETDNKSIDYDLSFIKSGFMAISDEAEKIVKSGQEKDFLDHLEKYCRDSMEKKCGIEQVQALKEIFETKKRIQENANARLALECLFLRLNKII